jgi:hypothetical protein
MTNTENDDEITTIKIVISRFINQHGKLAVKLELPNEWSTVEVLGLLETAKMTVCAQARKNGTV